MKLLVDVLGTSYPITHVQAALAQITWMLANSCATCSCCRPTVRPSQSRCNVLRVRCYKGDEGMQPKKDSASRGDAPAGPYSGSGISKDASGQGSNLQQSFKRAGEVIGPAHSSGGPAGGLLGKVQELGQRFNDTPGNTFKQRCGTSSSYVGGTDVYS